jgi:hypothetical protein
MFFIALYFRRRGDLLLWHTGFEDGNPLSELDCKVESSRQVLDVLRHGLRVLRLILVTQAHLLSECPQLILKVLGPEFHLLREGIAS